MKTYKYKNYDEYIKCQKDAYNKKFKNVWAKEENIKVIADYINEKIGDCNGLCHGVRQGYECQWFNKYLKNSIVIGTDIGGTVKDYIVQHDFNKQKNEFINKFDFIYSNSFDHAYNPQETFNIWCEQLIKPGFIILEYDRRQEHTGEISKAVNKVDPVSITVDELIKLVPTWNQKANINKILGMPIVTQEWRKAIFIKVEA